MFDDWESLRDLGHTMLDDIVDRLATVGERPAWQPVPQEIKSALRQPVPWDGLRPLCVVGNAGTVKLSRGFRALKAWMALKTYGVRAIAQAIEDNVDQAQHLRARIEEDNDLEVLGPAPMHVVCFRHRGGDDAFNREILLRLQEGGTAVLSSTRIAEQFVLRAAITNHRTRREDVDFVVEAVKRIAREIAEVIRWTSGVGSQNQRNVLRYPCRGTSAWGYPDPGRLRTRVSARHARVSGR